MRVYTEMRNLEWGLNSFQYFPQFILWISWYKTSCKILPDAVGGPLEVVVPPCFHEGQMQSLGCRLDMIRGECRGWTKYRHDSWLDEVTQLFTCLQVMSNFQFHKWPKIIILTLKESSAGNLAMSMSTMDLLRMVLSSFTSSIPLWKAASSEPECSSNNAPENETPLATFHS